MYMIPSMEVLQQNITRKASSRSQKVRQNLRMNSNGSLSKILNQIQGFGLRFDNTEDKLIDAITSQQLLTTNFNASNMGLDYTDSWQQFGQTFTSNICKRNDIMSNRCENTSNRSNSTKRQQRAEYSGNKNAILSQINKSNQKQVYEDQVVFLIDNISKQKKQKGSINQTSTNLSSARINSSRIDNRKILLKKMRRNIVNIAKVDKKDDHHNQRKLDQNIQQEGIVNIRIKSNKQKAKQSKSQVNMNKTKKKRSDLNINAYSNDKDNSLSNISADEEKQQSKYIGPPQCPISSLSPKDRKFVIIEMDDYKKWLDSNRKSQKRETSQNQFERHRIVNTERQVNQNEEKKQQQNVKLTENQGLQVGPSLEAIRESEEKYSLPSEMKEISIFNQQVLNNRGSSIESEQKEMINPQSALNNPSINIVDNRSLTQNQLLKRMIRDGHQKNNGSISALNNNYQYNRNNTNSSSINKLNSINSYREFNNQAIGDPYNTIDSFSQQSQQNTYRQEHGGQSLTQQREKFISQKKLNYYQSYVNRQKLKTGSESRQSSQQSLAIIHKNDLNVQKKHQY